MFPITKTIDKAMLRIGSRPAIDLIIGECRRCGRRPDRSGCAGRFVTGAGLLHTRSDLGIAAGTALLAVEGGGALKEIGRGIDRSSDFKHCSSEVLVEGTEIEIEPVRNCSTSL
jgi:UTP--glucose-1-phosphate uridylyltransferase